MSPSHAILVLDTIELLVYDDRERMLAAARELAMTLRPHMTLERRDRGSYRAPRQLWHPCETRFFDPRSKS